MQTHAIRVRKGCLISILRPTFDQAKEFINNKISKKIGEFEYFGDSDVVNKSQLSKTDLKVNLHEYHSNPLAQEVNEELNDRIK